MKQKLVPGMEMNFVTPDELVKLIPRPKDVERVRAIETLQLDASGAITLGDAGQSVYTVPAGMEFFARRVTLTLGNEPSDPNTGPILLTTAGHYVAYYRSDAFIEYAQPQYGAALQVPGVQTWGDQQGPYLRNKEQFRIICAGLTPSAFLKVILEGIQIQRAEG